MSYSIDTLEYERLLRLFDQNARTPMGKARFADLRPKTGRVELEADLAAITEAATLRAEKHVSWSFEGVQDPADAIAILKIRGAALEPNLILEIAHVCNQALFARAAIQPEKETAPTLWQKVELIPPTLAAVVNEIRGKLLPNGELDDSASAELAQLRREIAAQRTRITKSLESVIRASGEAIQDDIVTVRNDRFVIPVKSDFRGKVGGVAHGFSSSGATVFIEPLEAIEANNELQNLKGKEERETARILSMLTEKLREQLPAIECAADAVAELDFINAKVEFAGSFNAVVPEISADETLELIEARHPVLEQNLREQAEAAARQAPKISRGPNRDNSIGTDIVPSSFSLTTGRRVMIISGANAGGKTVVLKTAGLLSLMALSGLPVPAKSVRIPFYNSVLADIGDHQSLAANLSTFSSHMSNIARMMRECRAPALILLDEAGTGTDPDEGSALGVAIVEYFRKSGAHVIASTHYRGLKIYAANDASVINASVEFDEKTLLPTYKLLIGTAGASSGFEIAGRFGILPEVIEAARENIDLASLEAESYLRKIQTESKRAEDIRLALEEEREAVAMKYAGLEVEATKKEKARQKQFENDLAETIGAFDRQSQAFIETLQDKALKNKLDKERSARKAELNRAVISKISGKSVTPALAGGRDVAEIMPPAHASVSDDLAVGSRVITSLGSVGTVEKLDKDTAEVLVGNIRLREKISNLRLAAAEPTGAGNLSSPRTPLRSARVLTSRPIDTPDAVSELNLIGKTTAEAEYELDRFIDEAYMASLPRVRIIHGFGTGALKNFVHHFLRNHELVEKFAFASDKHGGNGATIADMRQ